MVQPLSQVSLKRTMSASSYDAVGVLKIKYRVIYTVFRM
jgi:hypothetical protein